MPATSPAMTSVSGTAQQRAALRGLGEIDAVAERVAVVLEHVAPREIFAERGLAVAQVGDDLEDQILLEIIAAAIGDAAQDAVEEGERVVLLRHRPVGAVD